ncbi:hypothetical protein EKO27_g6119 [Xylaria grammica]|uniref:Uncharacterized protein n=1 Tax=Xylaria grammica TaxID=363999 RepID=A0A439D3J2_9PEZI|nr:hypothetical protein EKO27_g6119 [Xylaria grammica]
MMAKSLMKLLAIPALLAGIAQSRPTEIEGRDDCPFTVAIPDNTYYQEGSNFVLTWNPDKLPPGTLDLQVQSSLIVPIITGYGTNIYGQTIPIYDFKGGYKKLGSPDLKERTYTWPVEIIANATGPEYVYSISGYYTIQYNPPYGDTTGYCTTPNFHVSASP